VHLAVDATVVSSRLKGAGRVVVNLLRALPGAGDEVQVTALAWPEGTEILVRDELPIKVVEVPEGRAIAWERTGLAERATMVQADVVLTLREHVGRHGPPTVLHLAEPPSDRLRGLRGRRKRFVAKDAWLAATMRSSIRHAAVVTAASERTAEWLRRHAHLDPPVIPPGIDPFFLERVTPAQDRPPYFLHPATGDARDNTSLVLQAFRRLPADTHLVLVGTLPDQATALRYEAAALGIVGRITFAGWVSDEELRDLYAGAIALVHPTRYEGFAGLQPLEAMAQGTPVIALDAPGVTEALGEAALLIEHEDPIELAGAMAAMSGAERARLAEAGAALAAGFTWEAAAARFVEVARTVA
jgi:glycosyltransferase involved in cell wall biosynthesis